MCGIAGFSISSQDYRKIQSRNLSNKLLLAIVARGEDATGMAWTEDTENGKEVFYSKEAMPAEVFVKYTDMIPRFTRTAILHTRYATKGSPLDNNNNHPIVIPNGVIGVHNGHISNDDELFEVNDWDRIGEVDSEAIFQMISNSNEPLTELPDLVGRAAIAWIEINDPHTLHLARLTGSPLVIGHTANGSLIFASTEALLKKAAKDAHVMLSTVWEVPEMLYLKVKAGKIVERSPIGDIPEEPTDKELFPYKNSLIRPYRHYSTRNTK